MAINKRSLISATCKALLVASLAPYAKAQASSVPCTDLSSGVYIATGLFVRFTPITTINSRDDIAAVHLLINNVVVNYPSYDGAILRIWYADDMAVRAYQFDAIDGDFHCDISADGYYITTTLPGDLMLHDKCDLGPFATLHSAKLAALAMLTDWFIDDSGNGLLSSVDDLV